MDPETDEVSPFADIVRSKRHGKQSGGSWFIHIACFLLGWGTCYLFRTSPSESCSCAPCSLSEPIPITSEPTPRTSLSFLGTCPGFVEPERRNDPPAPLSPKKVKLLHITYHRGCEEEVGWVMSNFPNVELTQLFWLGLNDEGNEKYNIDHDKAIRYYDALNADHDLQSFDIVLTSDTGPLARIFLQNNWPNLLVIWICNRFDYCDGAGCGYDEEFYQLYRDGYKKPNVEIYGYTPFENVWAQQHNVDVGSKIIVPSGKGWKPSPDWKSNIPSDVVKSETFFIPPYENDKRTPKICERLGIKCFRGRYAGPNDLIGFKALLHIPYAWSNLAPFEMWQRGLVYVIPTIEFLATMENIFWTPPYDIKCLIASAWYRPQHEKYTVKFSSWEELITIFNEYDFEAKSKEILADMGSHADEQVEKWKVALRLVE